MEERDPERKQAETGLSFHCLDAAEQRCYDLLYLVVKRRAGINLGLSSPLPMRTRLKRMQKVSWTRKRELGVRGPDPLHLEELGHADSHVSKKSLTSSDLEDTKGDVHFFLVLPPPFF